VGTHLRKEGIHPTMFCSHWFITLFAYTLPFDHLLRVWDVFFLEGPKIIFRCADTTAWPCLLTCRYAYSAVLFTDDVHAFWSARHTTHRAERVSCFLHALGTAQRNLELVQARVPACSITEL
jgi:hypothetical protein